FSSDSKIEFSLKRVVSTAGSSLFRIPHFPFGENRCVGGESVNSEGFDFHARQPIGVDVVTNFDVCQAEKASVIQLFSRVLPVVGGGTVEDARILGVLTRIFGRPAVECLQEEVAFAHTLVEGDIGPAQYVGNASLSA